MEEKIDLKELKAYIDNEMKAVCHLAELGINDKAIEVRYYTLQEILNKIEELEVK